MMALGPSEARTWAVEQMKRAGEKLLAPAGMQPFVWQGTTRWKLAVPTASRQETARQSPRSAPI